MPAAGALIIIGIYFTKNAYKLKIMYCYCTI